AHRGGREGGVREAVIRQRRLTMRPVMRLFLAVLLPLAALAVACRRQQDAAQDTDPPPPAERPAKADQAHPAAVRAVPRGNNAFAFDLHRKLPEGNLIFSPLSVSTALSMTYAGARGATASEMAKALRYPFEGERLHKGYAG